MNTPTPEQFDAACADLGQLVRLEAHKLRLRGYTCHETSDAPESYKALLAAVGGSKVIPIADYGCDNTIYDDQYTNICFRFWHDVTHIEHGLGFNKSDEMTVAAEHIRAAKDAGLSDLALEILCADTTGQVLYYAKYKRFVGHQKAFVYDCIRQGGLTTIDSGMIY